MYVTIYIYVYIYIHIYVTIYIYVCVCVCIYIYIPPALQADSAANYCYFYLEELNYHYKSVYQVWSWNAQGLYVISHNSG